MSFFKFIGTYASIGIVYGVYNFNAVNNEVHLLKTPELGYGDQDIAKLKKFDFCMSIPLWPVCLYDTIKYEPSPLDFEKMTIGEKRFYFAYARYMLRTVRCWDSKRNIGANIAYFLEQSQDLDFLELGNECNRVSSAYHRERKVRKIFRRIQDE